jgi:hypothetical protein
MKAFQWAIAVVAIAVLAGCEPSEFKPIPVPVGGEPAAPPAAPAQPAPVTPPAQLNSKLNVPDESVAAPNMKEAMKKCQQRAEELSKEKGKTIVFINVRRSVIRGSYVCQFQEV